MEIIQPIDTKFNHTVLAVVIVGIRKPGKWKDFVKNIKDSKFILWKRLKKLWAESLFIDMKSFSVGLFIILFK